MHGDTDTRSNYIGALRQVLIDLANWVENGVEPLPRSGYSLGEDGQIHLEPDIRRWGGMQAEITLTANGAKCAHVKAGEEVTLEVCARVPEGAGDVTELLLCPQAVDGPVSREDMWPISLEPERYEDSGVRCARAKVIASYPALGTYFAACRVSSERNGRKDALFTQVLNMDRVRIVVE